MENHLKLCLPLFLEELCLRKVAVLFCSKSDILDFFYQSLYSQLPTCEIKKWLKVTEEKMSKLGLPESLNKQVIDRIQAIGFDIRVWKERNNCQSFDLESEIELPDVSKLCWTSTRAIDHRKISEQYILCDRLEDWQRYKIACCNCMESHIRLLWNELSEDDKKRYKLDGWWLKLECCWPYILKGEQSKLDYLWRESVRNLTSFNQWAFEESAKEGKVAVEYFFQKLTPEEREVSLVRTACNVIDGDVLFFLLSVMTPEQQMETVKARPDRVLLSFLDWKRWHLLPENAGLVWTFLQQSNYGDLSAGIVSKLMRRDDNFPKFFEEFFKHAPLDFIKKSFEGHESDWCPPACRVLCQLIIIGDSESIEVIFRHADAASRVKLVFCDGVFHLFYSCILEETWHGVEACFRGAALSEEDRGTLKQSFMRFLDHQRVSWRWKRKFRRFFEFLHKTDANDEKEKKVKRLKLE